MIWSTKLELKFALSLHQRHPEVFQKYRDSLKFRSDWKDINKKKFLKKLKKELKNGQVEFE